MKESALFVVLGGILTLSGYQGYRNEKSLENEAKFWRQMYREAEADAKYKKCVELDRNYVICEKAAHGKER